MFRVSIQSSLRAFIAAVAVAMVLLSGLAQATLMEVFSKEALFARAHLVVEVRVEGLRALRAGRHQFIYTDARVRLEKIWHAMGPARGLKEGRRISLRQIGGRLGDIEHSVVGTAPVRAGDSLIIFARYEQGRLYLVGMGQGAFLVQNEEPNALVRSMFGARPDLSFALRGKADTRQQLWEEVRRLVRQRRGRK